MLYELDVSLYADHTAAVYAMPISTDLGWGDRPTSLPTPILLGSISHDKVTWRSSSTFPVDIDKAKWEEDALQKYKGLRAAERQG